MIVPIRILGVVLVTLLFARCVSTSDKPVAEDTTDQAPEVVEKVFDAPDQVIWSELSQSWFVSNLGGGISLEEDSSGWITKLDQHGNVEDPFWIGKKEGMHAPSGMTIYGDHLYVCDRNGVYEIDILKASVEHFYAIPEGEFINDIAADDDGNLYVSDFFGNRIFKINQASKQVEVWVESEQLKAPDGLYVDGNKLLVASWGVLSKAGSFETSELGDLLSVDLDTKEVKIEMSQIGNLEGITKAGEHYYITDWAAGRLLKVQPEKEEVVYVLSGLKHPTDPNYAEELGVLAFPQHGTDQVLFLDLKF